MNRQQLIDHQKVETEKAMTELFQLTSEFACVKNGMAAGVRALTTVLNFWITTEYKRYARTANSDDDLGYYDEVIKEVLDAIEFIVKVSEAYTEASLWRNELRESLNEGKGDE